MRMGLADPESSEETTSRNIKVGFRRYVETQLGPSASWIKLRISGTEAIMSNRTMVTKSSKISRFSIWTFQLGWCPEEACRTQLAQVCGREGVKGWGGKELRG